MPPHLLAFQHGTLHWVPDDKPTMIKFSKAHELRNEAGYLGKTLVSDHVHEGWQRLASIKYLQHKTSGKIVAVVGKATQFLSSLDDICKLAGLDAKELPFHPGEIRNLQRLLDPKHPLTELHDWEVVVDEPAQIGLLVPTGKCPKCSLNIVNISAALSPKRRRVDALGSESRYGRAHVCSIFRPRAGRWEPRRLAHRERAARACARVEQKKLLLENGLSLRRDVTPAAPRASGRGEGEALEATRGAIHGVDHTTRGGAFTTIHFHDY